MTPDGHRVRRVALAALTRRGVRSTSCRLENSGELEFGLRVQAQTVGQLVERSVAYANTLLRGDQRAKLRQYSGGKGIRLREASLQPIQYDRRPVSERVRQIGTQLFDFPARPAEGPAIGPPSRARRLSIRGDRRGRPTPVDDLLCGRARGFSSKAKSSMRPSSAAGAPCSWS